VRHFIFPIVHEPDKSPELEVEDEVEVDPAGFPVVEVEDEEGFPVEVDDEGFPVDVDDDLPVDVDDGLPVDVDDGVPDVELDEAGFPVVDELEELEALEEIPYAGPDSSC